jgi:hypothetical protein
VRRFAFFLVLLAPTLAQGAAGLPEGLYPAKGPLAVVLPLPPDVSIPQAVAASVTELRVLVPVSGQATARLPSALEALRRRVRTEVRVQRRPPLLAPALAGPNYLYRPGVGWTDGVMEVGIFWRIFNEAWQASAR